MTKYDDEKFCVCGFRGIPLRSWMIENPREARQSIDSMYLPNVDVLPPGQVGVIEVVTLKLLPVGRDGLLCILWLPKSLVAG